MQTIAKEELTAKQREVLSQLCLGLAYKEVAARSGISLNTVRTHVKRIYAKLGVRSRTEAAIKCFKTPDV